MSNIEELIRAEIERLEKMDYPVDTYEQSVGFYDALDRIKAFLDTLPDESEQPTRGYDEAYLNEKIAKASKSWEGVDVDKFMDEIRGREPVTDCHDLEEAADEWCKTNNKGIALCADKKSHYLAEGIDAFIAGAEWQKAKIMEVAEECELYWDGDFLAIDLNMRALGYSERDKVKIIIVKKDNNGH